MKYALIYLWRGERHRALYEYTTRGEANVDCDRMRANGWRAWVEEVA